jgi:hypothetical protein
MHLPGYAKDSFDGALVALFVNRGHIQITMMIDTQQQYINLNIRGEISIIMFLPFFIVSVSVMTLFNV